MFLALCVSAFTFAALSAFGIVSFETAVLSAFTPIVATLPQREQELVNSGKSLQFGKSWICGAGYYLCVPIVENGVFKTETSKKPLASGAYKGLTAINLLCNVEKVISQNQDGSFNTTKVLGVKPFLLQDLLADITNDIATNGFFVVLGRKDRPNYCTVDSITFEEVEESEEETTPETNTFDLAAFKTSEIAKLKKPANNANATDKKAYTDKVAKINGITAENLADAEFELA